MIRYLLDHDGAEVQLLCETPQKEWDGNPDNRTFLQNYGSWIDVAVDVSNYINRYKILSATIITPGTKTHVSMTVEEFREEKKKNFTTGYRAGLIAMKIGNIENPDQVFTEWEQFRKEEP